MAVVAILHTFTNISSTARKVGGFLLRVGESAKVPQDKVTKAERDDATAGVLAVAPPLPATIEDRDQALFELSNHGELSQVLSPGPAAGIAVQMPFKASALIAVFTFGTGGGAVSGLDLNDVTLKNNVEYDLTEVVFANDQSLNEVLLVFRP